ncbi:MAG: murein biosynthesis integral membrane protein MurJ [Candidatus Sumerlaeia bacterium]|nr:murein biosynthesis integral membrane protein MurJ [Candidatus Sumerlaeia bacterium]
MLGAAGIISAATAASRVLGVVRDALINAHLGASSYNDVFRIASTIPNIARRVLGEGALSAFIVPVVADVRRRKGEAAAWHTVYNAFNLFAVITLAMTVLGCIFAEPLFTLYSGARYYVEGQSELVRLGVSLTRVMFPSLMLLALVALLMGVCHTLGHFLMPALGSALLNIVMIAAALIFFRLGETSFLYVQAWAVVIGMTVRLLILFPPLIRRGFRWKPVFQPREEGFVTLSSKMPAAMYATAVAQINIAVSYGLAVWLDKGGVAYLYNSQHLIQMPLALFASALSTVLLPQLAHVVLEDDRAELRNVMSFSFRGILLIFMPATVGLMVLASPIVQLLFEYRKWTAEATAQTAAVLFWYSVGMVPIAAQRILIPLYYAQKDMSTPVKFGAWTMLANIFFSLILMWPLRFAGLALASSLAAGLNTWLLWRGLTPRFGRDFAGDITTPALKCFACAVVMGAVCWGGFTATNHWLHPRGPVLLALAILVWITVSIAVYVLAARIAGLWDRRIIAMMLKQG